MSETLLWSLGETARQLGGVSVRTVERLIENGDLPVIRIRKRRMIMTEVVHAWIAAQNEVARARMEQEKRPCRGQTETASTKSGHRPEPARQENWANPLI